MLKSLLAEWKGGMEIVREEATEGRGKKGRDEKIQGEEAKEAEKRKERERSSC